VAGTRCRGIRSPADVEPGANRKPAEDG